jgi:hypothetical protein
MKNLFIINEEEKNRILNLHETATKRQYLSEQPTLDLGQPSQPEVGPQTLMDAGAIVKQGLPPDPYTYAKLGNNYYFTKDTNTDNPDWVLATRERAINSIKSKIFDEKLPPVTTVKPPVKGKTKVQPIKKTDSKKTKITNKTKVEPEKTKVKPKTQTRAEINPELKKLGFTIDYNDFNKNVGYFVTKCKQKQCSEFTGDMLNKTFGDAWHAKENLDVKVNVDTNTVKKMETLFNKMNNSGIIPSLEQKTPFDNEAKEIVKKLIPDQSKFQNLPLGTVVGLYYPPSSNYDLAFFQGAIGKTRTSKGELKPIISHPYFCKNINDCKDTVWSEKDLGKKNKFVAGNTLKSGESFAPVTHLGFIGYKDKNGVPYIVHNIKNDVYAFPTNKLNPDGLQIIWAAKS